ncbi:transcription termination factor Rho [Corynebacterium sp. HMSC11E11]|uniref:transcription termination factor Rho n=1 Tax=Corynebacterium sp. HMSC11E11 TaxID=1581089 RepID=UPI0008A2A348|nr:transcription termination factor Rho [Corynebacterium sp. HMSC11E11]OFU53112.1 transcription termination factor Rho [Corynebacterium sp. HMSC11E11]
MTDTDTTGANQGQENLTALRMAELRAIASGKGIRGISAMRKHELIAAIQGAGEGQAPAAKKPAKDSGEDAGKGSAGARGKDSGSAGRDDDSSAADDRGNDKNDRGGEKNDRDDNRGGKNDRGNDGGNDGGDRNGGTDDNRGDKNDKNDRKGGNDDNRGGNDGQNEYPSRSQSRRARRERARQRNQENRDNQGGQNNSGGGDNRDNHGGGDNQGGRNRNRNRNDRNDDNEGRGNRRNRRNRRDRKGRDNQGGDGVREGDVLQPVAGIVDVMDNNSAFVRTSGYLPGANDVHVSQQLVRKYGLRKGDAITGQVRMPREGGGGQVTHGSGRNKRKYNPLVQVDTVNGQTPDEAKNRPEFGKLTPLYPNQRLRLETEQKILTTRVIDLIMPIGKGQRALIVSPPKAGKTTILQNIANAIATNNPECYMMVVLVDERPEEVTDMQRSVRGEVIASTFDRPPSDHTMVAELAIERAKRLVEQGQDVVVLLDSITRLGRAYNNSSPASGRILSGGVDSNALYPPKRFLGAARNIEGGGSLTIIATAMVETGSAGDTVIFEEFKGTGNAELKLDRKISERRVFPAVDVNPSGTRKDELLLAPEEARIMHKLRRILSALDPQAAIDLLIKQLKKTKNNREFLMQVATSAPMAADVDVDEML